MTDPRTIEALSTQLEALETATVRLATDPDAAVSVRRIARSLETAAGKMGLTELAAGAVAIQRAADGHLQRSVTNYLARVEELRAGAPVEDATILIVEDNRTVAAATQAYLKAPGRTLLVAESAGEASSILEARPVDIVVLDLILPDRDGRDVLVQMREHAETATVPVIVLSSTSGGVARAECLAVGADEFLEKPVDPKILRSAVTRQIRNGRVRRDQVLDGLTGLPNRAGIGAMFDDERRRCAKHERPLAVAALTIDSLAEVTMKLGRDAGDRFLLEVCAALHEAVGDGGHLGRWETAQLVAILPGREAEPAREVLAAAFDALARSDIMDEYRDAGIAVSLSGGVSAVELDQDLHEAISAAEKSLYRARASEETRVLSSDDTIDLRTYRILLVEDDRVTATLIHHRLVRDGHEVIDFEDGGEAYAWAKEEPFDLAILDVKIPGMDGFEVLGRLREIPRLADVPIIMLTGMGSEADVIRGLELGADDYMLKPFSPSELLARVRRLILARTTGDVPGRPGAADGPREARA